MEHLSVSPHLVKLLALLANSRLGWKTLIGTNAPAYYEITDVKSFITLAPGVYVINIYIADYSTVP